jgi:hypothetical protein
MRWVLRSLSCCGFLFVGYVVGSLQIGGPTFLRADPQSDSPKQSESIPEAVRVKVREANRALSDAMLALQDEKRYVPAIQGVNAFATSVGGVDAVADLESGNGVDPETFAALYAGLALPEVAESLARNTEGHMTYKNKVIRIYSPTRMKQLFALRTELAPAATGVPSTKKSAAPKKEGEAAAEKSE